MMPFCYWRRCRNVADREIDMKCDDQTAWLCKKHFNELWKKLGLRCEDE